MNIKEKFLEVKTYEEFDKRREEFRGIDVSDKEILDHLDSLFPKVDNTDFKNGLIVEVYKEKRVIHWWAL